MAEVDCASTEVRKLFLEKRNLGHSSDAKFPSDEECIRIISFQAHK